MFAGPQEEEFYFGASLGGIMGLMFTALSPDVVNANVDVPAINFSLLLQRSTDFIQFEDALELTGVTDPMQTALGLGIIHELWVRGESAGYATHITSNPLEGTNAKNILMTMAWLDQQVSNVATEIAARTLGLPNLVGSLRTNLAEIPDEARAAAVGAGDLRHRLVRPRTIQRTRRSFRRWRTWRRHRTAATRTACAVTSRPRSSSCRRSCSPAVRSRTSAMACATRPSRSNFRTAMRRRAIRSRAAGSTDAKKPSPDLPSVGLERGTRDPNLSGSVRAQGAS